MGWSRCECATAVQLRLDKIDFKWEMIQKARSASQQAMQKQSHYWRKTNCDSSCYISTYVTSKMMSTLSLRFDFKTNRTQCCVAAAASHTRMQQCGGVWHQSLQVRETCQKPTQLQHDKLCKNNAIKYWRDTTLRFTKNTRWKQWTANPMRRYTCSCDA